MHPTTESGGGSRLPSSPAQAPSLKLPELEGLRAWMAWWVVLGHMLIESGWSAQWLPAPLRLLMTPGFAVQVFIILSGFVITLMLDTQKPDYRRFVLTRFFRLFPLYYALLALALLSLPHFIASYPEFLTKISDPNDLQRHWADWGGHVKHLWQHLGLCLVGLHGAVPNAVLPKAHSAFLSQAWSLSLEWQFYLIAPGVFYLLRRMRGVLLLGAALFVIVGLRSHLDIGGWGSFLAFNVEMFALGTVSYYAFKHLRIEGSPEVQAKALAGVLLLCVLLCSAFSTVVFKPWTFSSFMDRWVAISLWVAVLAVLIARRHIPSHRIVRWAALPLNNRVATWLGKISYSTYLGHYLVIQWIQYLLVRHFPEHLNKYTALGAQLLVGIPLTITLSLLCYNYIEAPGVRLGRRLGQFLEKRERV